MPEILAQALQRCEGYCDLDMWEPAWEELESLPDEYRSERRVFEWRMRILMGMREWLKASFIGLSLCRLLPERDDLRLMTTECLEFGSPLDDALDFLNLSRPETWNGWAAWFIRARIQAKRGDLADAKAAVGRCVELAPERRLEILDTPEFEKLW